MIFFSSFLNAKVIDNTNTVIGTVEDAMIRVSSAAAEFPPLLGVVVRVHASNQRCMLRTNIIQQWGEGRIVISGMMERCEVPPEGDDVIYLRKAVLDKQIVDLSGVRVVRVNDLQFGQIYNVLSLMAIDISTLGLLRRIGISAGAVTRWFKPDLLEWKEVQILENKVQLNIAAKELIKLHPADIANVIEKLNVHRGSLLLESLDKDTAARVLEEVQPDIQQLLVKRLGTERATDVMAKMSTDELVDLINLLPSREAQTIINRFPMNSKTQRVKGILEYDEDTAGGLMSTEYLSLAGERTVRDAVEEIKRVSAQFRSIQFVYIVNTAGVFQGVVSLRSLIVAEPNVILNTIMKLAETTATVTVDDSLTEVAEVMTKYNLMSIAVLETDGKLLGVITVDDIMRNFLPHA